MPGTSPSRAPYLIGAGAVLVVVVLAVVLGVVLIGGDDEPEAKTDETSGPATSAETETETEASSEAPAAAYTCWDGAAADVLEDCTTPSGEAGLQWVFPAIAQARCGQAAAAGGATTRVLCIARLEGTKVQLGFFEWPAVPQGLAFYDGQGLSRTEATDGVVRWTGPGKAATMYAAAPFSVTVTYPEDAGLSPDQLAAFEPRPAAELTGVPAS